MPNTPDTIMGQLRVAHPNTLPDMLRTQRLDRMFYPIDVTCTITSAASIDITTLVSVASGAGGVATATSPLELGEALPPIRNARSLRVVTGTATGARAISDAGATPTTSLATLSQDGKTLTFEAAITVFRLVYFGASAISPNGDPNTPSP
jgi:hypothetical protein